MRPGRDIQTHTPLVTSTSARPLRCRAPPSDHSRLPRPKGSCSRWLLEGGRRPAAPAARSRPADPVRSGCRRCVAGHAARSRQGWQSPVAWWFSRATRSGPWMSRTSQARTPHGPAPPGGSSVATVALRSATAAGPRLVRLQHFTLVAYITTPANKTYVKPWIKSSNGFGWRRLQSQE